MIARFLRSGFTYSKGAQHARFPGISSPFDLQNAVQEVFGSRATRSERPAARISVETASN